MKKTVMGVVLVLIIIAAVVFVVNRMNRPLPSVKKIMDERTIKLADITDLANFKIVEVPLRVHEWEVTIDPKTNYMYHAKSGKTYAHALRCMSCKREIPMWPTPDPNPQTYDPTYRCPLCGGLASALAVMPPRDVD